MPSCQAVHSAFSQGGVGVMAPTAIQQGKKNATARQVSLSSGVVGTGIDRVEAARAWLSLALVARRLYASPLGSFPLLVCLWRWITALVLLVPSCYIRLI